MVVPAPGRGPAWRGYGITMPGIESAERGLRRAQTQRYDGTVECPWCESSATRLVSPYGPSVAEMMFECDDCGQSFGWLKWERRLPD